MSIPGRVAYTAGSIKVLVDAGVVRPIRPDRLLLVLQTLARWGRSAAAGTITLAARYPDDTAIIDELGALTYSELHTRTNALAHSLSDMGIGEGDGVAIMCRNHRGFIEATVAVSKLGADALYLNTAFAGPQLTEVVGREKPKAIVYDEEFGDLLAEAGRRRKRIVAWHDSKSLADPTLDELITAGSSNDLTRARARGSKRHPPQVARPGRPRARPGATPSRSIPWCRCCRGSRCARARSPTSRRRSFTPGASRTSRSASSSARPSCYGGSSIPRAPWLRCRATAATGWWWYP